MRKNDNSNPVAPTIKTLGKRGVETKYPVALPVAPIDGNLAISVMPDPLPGPVAPNNDRAALALATAAQALLSAIQTLGQGNPAPAASLSLAHAQASPPPASSSSMSVTELINDLLKAKARSGRSDRYLRQLRVSLSSFQRGRAQAPIAAITTADVERWLGAQDWSKKTASNYLADVRTMFNFAIKRGYLATVFNPAAGAEALNNGTAEGEIEIHTPAEVSLVLETARRVNLDVMRHLAIRYFAGIRSAEAHRLRESDLKLEHGLIEVPAKKAKTASRRLVTIQPALSAWLALGGELRPLGDFKTIRPTIAKSNVRWVHNACRHSFISYHIAAFQNAGKTALEAGTGEANIFRHYRALVTPAQAAEFWAIRPKQA